MSREGFREPWSTVHSSTPYQISEEDLIQLQWLCPSPGAHSLRFKQPSVRTTAGCSHHTGQAVGSKMSCPVCSLAAQGQSQPPSWKGIQEYKTALIPSSANSAVHSQQKKNVSTLILDCETLQWQAPSELCGAAGWAPAACPAELSPPSPALPAPTPTNSKPGLGGSVQAHETS